MSGENEKVLDIILDEIKHLRSEIKDTNERVRHVEKKIVYFAGLFSGLGAMVSLSAQKIWALLTGQ